ncbi:Oxidoreductase [Roseomonas mucosa]|uniref:1,5-anhydro-D-fructose reductase n=1 Tax=Roseomonas mucosa TaxID=207340 RepID=A0A379N274_9PROT|nr:MULTISPECIES: Gfo/Idh/MocA family oxidoreductase [Roseomonas]MBS5903999.1 Gfo/Idh/MocA family oxidoreductase [Acetobacteraceae bacterium]AWV22063.1 Oxidoreductase [Roseomonas mucosa]MCG7350665.1 Gfo/Idh/MocA family oxidoreductase [Roseomonas mucosa]MCG7357908.1 Gfo/Idh/MocA family oxidoreductase [Roseomonas mucosa]MDT8290300.1 Gfo/Idh/MocA family oxidoreductase [Roseomonas mucosa]
MAERRIGLIMHGVTGRMGMNQHLIRSIAAIRKDGGVPLKNGDRLMPDPILVGRNREKLEALARAHGVERVGTDLDEALANKEDEIFFDAGTTQMRAALIRKAIAAGKHIYTEKPTADNLEDALDVARLARKAGVKNGAVQDKLFLPGLVKLKMAIDSGFFGKILSVRGEFGYWVFEGDLQPTQRPSWNYKKDEGGGIILDMLCHWRYVLDNLFGETKAVSCLGATHIPRRIDEKGEAYEADADDAAYATFELEGGVIAQINSSWVTRVRRDDLVTFHVDGTHGSAVAGLMTCRTQSRVNTPKPVWSPDTPQPIDFFAGWEEIPDTQPYPNGFRVQWELFLRHVAGELPEFKWNLLAAAKGVQLAEAGLKSWAERRWIDLPKLEV